MKRLNGYIFGMIVGGIIVNITYHLSSQEHQQLTEQLSGISADMNILLQLSEIK